MKIIIIGCGNVGATLTQQLSGEKHDITVIDTRRDEVQAAVNNYDVMGIVGNGASYSIMKDAGIEQADLMIAVTDADELNLLCCLIARKAGHCHTIARVRDPIYRKEIGFIKEELGLSMTINPEEAAADEAVRLLKFPSANKIETFARGRAELVRLTVEEDSILCGKSLKEIQAQLHSRVLFSVIARENDVFIPNGSSVIRAKDEVTLIGAPRSMVGLFRKLRLPTAGVASTMIIGGGDTAYYLARQLILLGINVRMFEKDRARCDELTELLPEALIINADGTDKDRLMEGGLTGMDAVVSLTGIDEENIMLSLFIKGISKAKLITKIHRMSYGDLAKSLDIGSILVPKYITAEKIVQYVRAMSNSLGSNIETLYRMNDGRIEVLEFLIDEDAPVIGIPLQDMRLKKGVLVASIIHQGEVVSPNGQSVVAPGDSVVIVTDQVGFRDIREILRA